MEGSFGKNQSLTHFKTFTKSRAYIRGILTDKNRHYYEIIICFHIFLNALWRHVVTKNA